MSDNLPVLIDRAARTSASARNSAEVLEARDAARVAYDAAKIAGRMTAPLDHRETSDCYHGELFRDGDYRVVVCKDGIQWLLQRRKKSRAGARWIAIAYCTTRKALTRLWHGKTGRIHPDLVRLPRVLKRSAV